MTAPIAFRATYADWRLVKTRGVVQVVFELPLSESDIAYQVLGGMPNAAKEAWFGVAPLTEGAATTPKLDKPLSPRKPVSPEKRLAQQAAITCSDPVFQRFLQEHSLIPIALEKPEITASDYVRHFCNIQSRSEILPGTEAARLWEALYGRFTVWRDYPDVAEPAGAGSGAALLDTLRQEPTNQ